MKKPELLAPAGSRAMLDTAFDFGADAIYAGQPRYSLRVRNNDFGDLAVLAGGIQHAHTLGKKFYLVSNILPHGNQDVTIEALWSVDGKEINVAPGSGHIVYAKIPCASSSAYLARYIQNNKTSPLDLIAVQTV